MRLDITKLHIAQARTGKTLDELGISRDMIYRARKGVNLRPVTVYKIATALGCDPAEIVKDGGRA